MDTDLLQALYARLGALGIPDTDDKLRIRRKQLDAGFVVEISYDREPIVFELADTEDEALMQALQVCTLAFEGVLDAQRSA